MKYTIEDLRKGKCAVKNDGTLEELKEVLQEAFPEDDRIKGIIGSFKFYYSDFYGNHYRCLDSTDLPVQSVKDFIVKKELTFPRVMLVSDEDCIKDAVPRVVFMTKNGKFIAWANGKTLEDVEKTTAHTWDYAWEIEEKSIFPFSLKPIDAQNIIDIACDSWKDKLAEKWGYSIVRKVDTIVTEEEYNEMYEACTSEQKELFDKIFK